MHNDVMIISSLFTAVTKETLYHCCSIDGFIGPKVTSGLCLYIVAPATNTVKVMSNEAGLRLLYYGMCFTYIHLFVMTRHNIKLFQKALLNKHEHVMHV